MTVNKMDTNQDSVFDPLAWLNQQDQHAASEPFASNPQSNAMACQPLSHSEELAKATAVAHELINRNANIAEDYLDYVRLGFALADGLGSDGHDLYHMLCAHSTKYRRQDCERKWQECLRKADGRTSIATFYHMARQAGVDIGVIAREVTRNHF